MIIEEILKINPNAVVSVIGENIDDCQIKWLENTKAISKSKIKSKINELKAEYDAEEWKRNRQAEYPSHEDCIHALLDGGDTLTKLQEKRQAVKTKYPKP